jgi:protein SCO1/2
MTAVMRSACAGAFAVFAALLQLSAQLSAQQDVRGGDRWGRDWFPNVELRAHDGRTLRFFDDLLLDKVVAINFIYTRCPDACPLETARLAEVYQILGDRMGRDVFFYSITIDPDHDTPAVLAEYAQRHRAGPGWLFLTGRSRDIALLRERLGLFDGSDGDDGSVSNHSLSLVISNQATGRWMRSSPFENPYFLATELGDWLHNWKLARKHAHDYSQAPALRTVDNGERLFRTRCSACHTVGTADGVRRQGPDLLGVTARRDRQWLVRWLMAPDAMLAAHDPLATQLSEAWGRIAMPNLRLDEGQAEAVLDFLADESRRAAGSPQPADAANGGERSCCRKQKELTLAADAAAAPASPASGRRPLPWSSVLSIGMGLLLGACAWSRHRAQRRAASIAGSGRSPARVP